MKLSKAKVAKVQLGELTIDGLMMPNGEYRIAVVQLVGLILASQNHATRDLKALLGKDFTPTKVQSELNSNKVNTMSISEFHRALVLMSSKGKGEAKEVATNMVLSLGELSLTELFNDAFDVANTEDTRHRFLKARMFGKVQRRKFTDSIKEYQKLHGYSHSLEYARLTNIIYMALWGFTASDLEGTIGAPVRDNLSPEQLHRLEKVEDLAGNLMLIDNMGPEEAVKRAVLLTS